MKRILYLIAFTVTAFSFSSVKAAEPTGELNIAGYGIFNFDDQSGIKLKHLGGGGRLGTWFGNTHKVLIGGGANYLQKKSNNDPLSTLSREVISLFLYAGVELQIIKAFRMHLLATPSYNFVKISVTGSGVATIFTNHQDKLGAGGVAGFSIELSPRWAFFLEGNFDYINTKGTNIKLYGGHAGVTAYL